jgi:beta-N-acetylhexosaminidase
VKKIGEKVGEMFMVGFMETDTMAASDLIRRYHVGGIILFSRNVRNAAHAREVCERLQQLRREVSDAPLFIAIDQEGGAVARITEGVTVFPGNMALGATGSEHLALQAGGVMATELSTLGINVNFAPVLDITSNPGNPGVGARSFGSDAALVARLGSAMIMGLQEKGINATAKHFPGLGEAQVDSHHELPLVNASREQLKDRELLPFRAAIDVEVAFIMTAHCSYASLDSSLVPATLSRPIITGLLRERMRFGGIIITDCLEMAAVEKSCSPAQSAVMAVEAGANMILICHTFEKQVAAIESLVHAVEAANIPEEMVDTAMATISSVKNRLSFEETPSARTTEPQTPLSESIATEAITIVRNQDSLIPLRLAPPDRLAVIVPAFEALTNVEEAAEPHEALVGELRKYHPNVIYQKVAVKPASREIRECMNLCKGANASLILTYNLHQYPEQHEFVRAILKIDKPAVIAAVRDPYDLAFVPEARSCIAAYSFRECSLKALARVLFGKADANGRLPVGLA